MATTKSSSSPFGAGSRGICSNGIAKWNSDRILQRAKSKNFLDGKNKSLDGQKNFGGQPKLFFWMEQMFLDGQNILWTDFFFGRPIFFGRPKIFWTAKTKFGRQKKVVGRPKENLAVQFFFGRPKN